MSSKIKVDTIENVAGSGNVSLGSGHNLVVPGDLTVDTNLLDVDASNDTVGIGTTVNTRKLNINAGSFGHMLLDTADASHGIQILGQTNATANSGFDIQYSSAGGLKMRTLAVKGMSFQTSASAGSPAEHLAIDASGNITKPSQPRFCAYISGNNLTFSSLADNQVVDFNSVNVNTGNHYSTSTHLFTAPVAGTYWFGVTMRIDNIGSSGSDYWHGYLGKNGSTVLEGSLNGRMISTAATLNIFNHISGSWIVQLAANDTIGVYHGDGNSAGVHAGSAYYQPGQCNFSGYLLA